jgi:DNA-binding LacI/PurR family transcriptional regulator
LAGGQAMMRALLEQPGPKRPTAVLVYNDLTAIGALRALNDSGIRVPDDVALIGTDGIELGEYTSPPLTTVDHPREELGRLAIETICALLAGQAPAETERVLSTRLIVRASCGGQRVVEER